MHPFSRHYMGRLLEIEDKCMEASEESKELIKYALILFFQNHEMAWKVRSLKTVFRDRSPDNSLANASYNADDDIMYVNILSVGYELLRPRLNGTRRTNEEIYMGLGAVFAHECMHKIKGELNNHSKIRYVASQELYKHLEELSALWSHIKEKERISLVSIRSLIHQFVTALQDEGLGRFVEHERKGIIKRRTDLWTEEQFILLYNKAIENSKDFLKEYERSVKQRKFEDIIMVDLVKYEIGLHMVYAILYLDKKMDLDSIMKMSYYDFIRRYEKLMESKGLRPVFSLYSGKGILDYKRMLIIFWRSIQR